VFFKNAPSEIMVLSLEKKLSISIKRNERAYIFCCADIVAPKQVTPTTLKDAFFEMTLLTRPRLKSLDLCAHYISFRAIDTVSKLRGFLNSQRRCN
jgi:hypothetical protein